MTGTDTDNEDEGEVKDFKIYGKRSRSAIPVSEQPKIDDNAQAGPSTEPEPSTEPGPSTSSNKYGRFPM